MTYGVSGTIQIVTKRFDVEHSKDRIFEGIATVEMVDKQNDLTVRDVLYDQFPVWMKRGAPINDSHSNRVVGKGLDYQKVTIKSGGKSLPAIKLTGQIYTDTEADDKVWKQIQSGEYKGLSFGGAAKNKTRMRVRKDGRVINKLDDLEMYEVSICKSPVVPLALITSYSQVAKAVESGVDPSTMQIAGDVPVRCQMECDIAKGISARDGDVNKMSRKHKDDDEEIVVEEEEEKSKGEGQAAINESVYKAFEAVDSEFTEYSEKMDAMYKALKESLKATQDIDERLKALEKGGHKDDDEDKADDDDDEKGDDEDKDKGKRKSVVKGQRPQQASGKTGVLNVLAKARELGPGNQSELAEYVRGLTVND